MCRDRIASMHTHDSRVLQNAVCSAHFFPHGNLHEILHLSSFQNWLHAWMHAQAAFMSKVCMCRISTYSCRSTSLGCYPNATGQYCANLWWVFASDPMHQQSLPTVQPDVQPIPITCIVVPIQVWHSCHAISRTEDIGALLPLRVSWQIALLETKLLAAHIHVQKLFHWAILLDRALSTKHILGSIYIHIYIYGVHASMQLSHYHMLTQLRGSAHRLFAQLSQRKDSCLGNAVFHCTTRNSFNRTATKCHIRRAYIIILLSDFVSGGFTDCDNCPFSAALNCQKGCRWNAVYRTCSALADHRTLTICWTISFLLTTSGRYLRNSLMHVEIGHVNVSVSFWYNEQRRSQ